MSELKPRITENGIDYILVGDYYIPDLKLPKEKFYEYAHHSSIEKALELIKTINSNPYSEDTKLYFIYKDEIYIVEVRGLKL